MFGSIFKNLREKAPLIHNITNFVTANDCANILIAAGASPIMANDPEEVFEITSICAALNINIGTLNKNLIPSMLIAGRRANELNHPLVLDPVGAGASEWRTKTAIRLLEEIPFSLIRGNISEIKAIALGSSSTKGVEADRGDRVSEENLEEEISFAKSLAKKLGAVVAITGEIDIVADEKRAYCIRNGNSMMAAVSGTGCQLSALIAAFLAANPDRILEAGAAAVSAMGLAGEIAYRRLNPPDGNASYRNYLIDALYHLTPEELERGAKYEIR